MKDLEELSVDELKQKYCISDKIRKVFKINDVECKAANAFAEKHSICKAHPIGGSKFSYIFTPTIGMNVHIKCLICGKKKDITDYDCW